MCRYGRLVLEGKAEPATDAKFSAKHYIIFAAMDYDRKASWLLCDYALHGKYGFELSIQAAANWCEKTERRLLSDTQLSYADDALEMEAIALYQKWRKWHYRHWSEQRIFELGLSAEERNQLEEYKKLISDAQYELNESNRTRFMSDSKSAVYELTYETAWSTLPGEVKLKLQDMSDLARKYVVCGPNEQVRAMISLEEVEKIEKYVDQLLRG